MTETGSDPDAGSDAPDGRDVRDVPDQRDVPDVRNAPDAPDDQPAGRFSHRTMVFLIAAGAVILLLVGATAGLALSGRIGGSDTAATPATDSVDAGFARDMAVHHDQGVLMAHYAEQNTSDPEIDVMAYDIGYTQTDQLGQMQGWLSLWDLPDFQHGTADGLDGWDPGRPRHGDGDRDRQAQERRRCRLRVPVRARRPRRRQSRC